MTLYIGCPCSNIAFSRSASDLSVKVIIGSIVGDVAESVSHFCKGTDFAPPAPARVFILDEASWGSSSHYAFNTTFHKLNMRAAEYVCLNEIYQFIYGNYGAQREPLLQASLVLVAFMTISLCACGL